MPYRTRRKDRRRFWSTAAKNYVDKKTDYLIEEEDISPGQAYAIAISMARSKGYKIPERRKSYFPLRQ